MAFHMQQQQYKRLTGVVVSAGKMMKTVKVRISEQKWNRQIQKYYPSHYNLLVSDPRSSLLEGDVVTIRSGWRTSKHVRHVVTSIVSPMGKSISERPSIPTEVERLTEKATKRAEKDVRQAARGRKPAVARVKALKKEQVQQIGGSSAAVKGAKDLSRSEEKVMEESTGVDMGQVESALRGMSLSSHDEHLDNVTSEVSQIRQELARNNIEDDETEAILAAAQEAQQAEQEALRTGDKTLAPSVEGGEQEVGELNERSSHNVRKTINQREKALENEERLKELEAKSDGQTQKPDKYAEKPGEENQKKKGWFGGLF